MGYMWQGAYLAVVEEAPEAALPKLKPAPAVAAAGFAAADPKEKSDLPSEEEGAAEVEDGAKEKGAAEGVDPAGAAVAEGLDPKEKVEEGVEPEVEEEPKAKREEDDLGEGRVLDAPSSSVFFWVSAGDSSSFLAEGLLKKAPRRGFSLVGAAAVEEEKAFAGDAVLALAGLSPDGLSLAISAFSSSSLARCFS